MCGRYVINHSAAELQGLFDVVNPERLEDSRHFNIAPTTLVPVVYANREGARAAARARWGLVPRWVAEPREWRAATFNARGEEAPGKPAFREAFRTGRVLVPASGYYEWTERKGARLPHYVRRRDGAPLAFAGVMDVWRGREGERRLVSCAILTTRPNDRMRELHHRMPVILARSDFAAWLDRATGPEDVRALLKPCPDDDLVAHRVSTAVNAAGGNDPRFVEPVAGT